MRDSHLANRELVSCQRNNEGVISQVYFHILHARNRDNKIEICYRASCLLNPSSESVWGRDYPRMNFFSYKGVAAVYLI